ncbi:MAG: Mlc titration factor MtfA (ptsG expression regulator) [Paraglaciecola sp.]|jgi:Mlc titration factor MtfA (ptsG expression regulator)
MGTSIRTEETWHRDPVILAWGHVLQGVRDSRDGHNVVMHKFAHKSDKINAAMDGLSSRINNEQEHHKLYVHGDQLLKRSIKIANRCNPSSSSDSAEANDKRTYWSP